MSEIGYFNELRDIDYRHVQGVYTEILNDPMYTQDSDPKGMAVDITQRNKPYDAITDGLVGGFVWLREDNQKIAGGGIRLAGYGRAGMKYIVPKKPEGQGVAVAGQGAALAGQGAALAGQGVAVAGQGVAVAGQGVAVAGQGIQLAGHGGGKCKCKGKGIVPKQSFKIGAPKRRLPASKLKKKLLKDEKKMKSLMRHLKKK